MLRVMGEFYLLEGIRDLQYTYLFSIIYLDLLNTKIINKQKTILNKREGEFGRDGE